MEYADVVPGKLKLKKVKGQGGVKKKKTVTSITESKVSSKPGVSVGSSAVSKHVVVKTKAEIAFEERKKQQQLDRVMKKAEKSHKQRVEAFNDLLSSVPEFNDIPKVSWTK